MPQLSDTITLADGVKPEQINTIIWDLGGVWVDFNQNKTDSRFAADCGRDVGEVTSILFGGSHKGREYNSGIYTGYNRGEIGDRGFYELCKSHLGLNMDFDEFRNAWADQFTLFEGIVDRVMDLSVTNTKQVIFLSTNPMHIAWINQMLRNEYSIGFSDIIAPTRQFFSYSPGFGMKKDNPKNFTEISRRLGVKPSSIVYVDDIPKYGQVALDSGVGAFVHARYPKPGFQEHVVKDLKRLGFGVD